MDLIGKTTINPFLFYSGKISGYYTWVMLLLLLINYDAIMKISYRYNSFVAIPLLLIGLIFIILSLINLGSSTSLGLPSEQTVFKTNGLYKISRNPMYLGFNFLTMASILYTLNIYIILPGIYSIFVYHLIILGEERFLENRFGGGYKTYKMMVRRYF